MTNLVEQWARFWSEHDVDGLLSLFAEDAVYEDTALRHRTEGAAAIRDFVAGTFVTFPDFRMEIKNSLCNAQFGAGEWTMSGTFAGESFGDKPTGKRFRVSGCCFMVLHDGKIMSHCDYWDEKAFNEQVGP